MLCRDVCYCCQRNQVSCCRAWVLLWWLWVGYGCCSMQHLLSRLDKQSKYLAYYHGGYGIGATISPLIATSIVNSGSAGIFYLILLGLMVITAINLYFSFQNADEDLKPWDHDEAVHSSSTSVELENLTLELQTQQ